MKHTHLQSDSAISIDAVTGQVHGALEGVVADAMDESERTASIVHIDYSDDLAEALHECAEAESIEGDGTLDYSGWDCDGEHEWRIRLDVEGAS